MNNPGVDGNPEVEDNSGVKNNPEANEIEDSCLQNVGIEDTTGMQGIFSVIKDTLVLALRISFGQMTILRLRVLIMIGRARD